MKSSRGYVNASKRCGASSASLKLYCVHHRVVNFFDPSSNRYSRTIAAQTLEREGLEPQRSSFRAQRVRHRDPRTVILTLLPHQVNRLLSQAMDEERFLYMELVYPLAKRIERAFDTNNKTEIEAIKSMRRRPYTTAGKVADGVIDIPFDIEDDGFYGTYKPKHGDDEDNVDPFALPENVR
jgi:hypothetical protein